MTIIERNPNSVRWLLVASVLAALLSFGLSIMRGDALLHLDERVYHGLAQTIVESHVYSLNGSEPSVYRPPGYAGLLAALYSVWPSVYAAKLLNAVCVGLIAWLAGLMAERVRPGSGWIAAVLLAGYPLLQYTSTTLYPQTVSLLLLLASLWIAFGSVDKGRMVAAGMLFGAQILMVPSFMLLLPFFALAVTWSKWGTGTQAESLRSRVTAVAIFCTMAALVVAPWTLRNYVVFGEVVPVSANGGVNLLAGNCEYAGANTGGQAVNPYRAATQGMTEIERDRYFKAQAYRWIEENPAAAAKLYVLKFANYFNFKNEVVAAAENPGRLGTLVLFVTQYAMMALVLVRVWMARSRPLDNLEKAIIFIYLLNGLISAVFYTRLRYRLPFDGLLMVVAAVAAADLLARWRVAHVRSGRT